MKIAREFFRLAREWYPACRRVLGTWCFDVLEESDGEYAGLAQILAEDDGWVDYLMADSHEDFPPYLLEQGAPGGFRAEFCRNQHVGTFPLGGSGANPLPARFQRLWQQAAHLLAGGFPYSEGNFEDINKVICSQFYWDKAAQAAETVRAYIAYEFSPAVVEPVAEAIELLERTYPHEGRQREDVERAYTLLTTPDTLLPPRARACWRWRILFLRAVIDYELINNANQPTDRCDEAYEELLQIFHLEHGWFCVAPPSRAYLARRQASLAPVAPAEALPPGAEEGVLKETPLEISAH